MTRQSAANVVGNTYGCFQILEIKDNKVIVRCIKCNQIYEKSLRMLELIIKRPVEKCISCNAHLPGTKYGSIEVLEKLGKSSYKIYCHNCKRELTISGATMTSYKELEPNGCKFCLKRNHKPTSHFTGEIIYCYKLIKQIKHEKWLVECCHCGRQQELSLCNINKTKPERCYFCDNPKAKENPRSKHKVLYEDIDERIYHYYKNRILDQNDQGYKFKEWNLSLDDYKTLIHGDCYYCGEKPTTNNMWNNRKNKRKTGNENLIAINGIDRIDSSKGYTIDNCVSCCSSCNTLKSDLSQKVFFEKISKIYKKHCSETIEKHESELSRVELSDSKQSETE